MVSVPSLSFVVIVVVVLPGISVLVVVVTIEIEIEVWVEVEVEVVEMAFQLFSRLCHIGCPMNYRTYILRGIRILHRTLGCL